MADFKRKNTVGWTAPDKQVYIRDCHKEISRLQVESNLWHWTHEQGCFVQQNLRINAFKKWTVLDSEHDIVADGSTPIEAMKQAERTFENNLENPKVGY